MKVFLKHLFFTLGLVMVSLSGMADDKKPIKDPRFKPLQNPAKPASNKPRYKKPRDISRSKPTIAPTRPYSQRHVKTFTLTGSQAIAAAKKYGYSFSGDQNCPFNGVNGWMAYPHQNRAYCRMNGFWNQTGRSHCWQLRQGWRIKNMQFSRDFEWMVPWRENEPWIRLTLDNAVNRDNAPLVILLDSVTLQGPASSTNAEDAFSHCAELNYSAN
ncbi:MAG: hypothetical protein Q9M92_02220 [Enterobacterales bacterium]|nr:hypothetical protein [Enterobacterales bacterium]